MKFDLRLCLGAWLLASCLALPTTARGEVVVASAPAAGAQPALSVGFNADGQLRASTCAAPPCDLDSGSVLDAPRAVLERRAQAQLAILRIGQQRHAAWVRVPSGDGTAWEAIVVARPGQTDPAVLFAGATGWATGEDGLRRGGLVQLSARAADGSRKVIVGEQREDITICGRPTVLAPQLLVPDDLRLHPAKVQRLSRAERGAASTVVAVRVPGPPAVSEVDDASGVDEAATAASDDLPRPAAEGGHSGVPLLRVIAASSARGAPAALTDGDPNSVWSENRGGAGRGEFIVMRSSSAIPILGFLVTIRPSETQDEQGAAPREFWLASNDQLVKVRMPEDAWQHPGASYRIALERPWTSDCLSLVVQSAWQEQPRSNVTFAELQLLSEFHGADLPALVGALAGGGDRAQSAAAILGAAGSPGHAAVVEAFPRMDDGARRVALELLDQSDCAATAPAYIEALLGAQSQLREHARTRFAGCGKAMGPALEAALDERPEPASALLATALATADPARGVRAIARRLSGEAGKRQLLRRALALAARSSDARGSVQEVLDTPLPVVAKLDVLRALGQQLLRHRQSAERALAEVLRDTSFRTRYLALEPASQLARGGSAAASTYLRRSLSSRNAHVRQHAAELLPKVAGFESYLLAALDDDAVRVREAAVTALSQPQGRFAAGKLLELLREDPWPMVRQASAAGIARFGPEPSFDEALANALQDDSAEVRRSAVAALGARASVEFADDIRDLLSDDDELPMVRRAAARALGHLCDTESADALRTLALRVSDPMVEQEQRSLGHAALEALIQVRPQDARELLAPLLTPETPALIREGVGKALRSPSKCLRSPALPASSAPAPRLDVSTQ